MLTLDGIHKSFDDGDRRLHVLRGIDLTIAAGESVALQGASGSGKSTLLHVAAGLEAADRGDVRVGDRSLRGLDEAGLAQLRRRELGFVFQQYNLLPGLTAEANVLFQRRLNGLPDTDDWTQTLLDELEIRPFLRQRVEQLSGGQQQRVAIARALAHRPRLVFADEPTGNLHDEMSQRVMQMLFDLVAASHCALLLVTHSQAMAGYLKRRVELKGGRLC